MHLRKKEKENEIFDLLKCYWKKVYSKAAKQNESYSKPLKNLEVNLKKSKDNIEGKIRYF